MYWSTPNSLGVRAWQVATGYTFLNNAQIDGARGILEFQLTPTQDVVYFASWAVHTYERESLNVARWIKSPSVKVQVGPDSQFHPRATLAPPNIWSQQYCCPDPQALDMAFLRFLCKLPACQVLLCRHLVIHSQSE